MRKYWVTAVFSFLAFFLAPINTGLAPGESTEPPSVVLSNVRYWPDSNNTRIILDLNDPTAYFDKYLPNPDRIYIDLYNTMIIGSIEPLQIGNGIVNQVRAAQHDKQTVRIVLDLTGVMDYKIFPLTSPDRLVIDIFKELPGGPAGEAGMKSAPPAGLQTIVIDPGHGGADPGAIGKQGLMEKDIVLDVALRLRRLVENKLGAKVLMTRDEDIFIPLGERTAIANRKRADLFVSIHANSSRREGARGVETYLLGKATDKEAMEAAMRENSAAGKSSLDDLQWILTDLLITAKKEESLRLAHYVHGNMIDRLEPRYKTNNLGVKQAPFYVLVNAKMPSILAEISFISNPDEERLLARDAYRQEIAEAIFEGIKRYVRSTPMLVQPEEARSK